MATAATLRARVRLELGDEVTPFQASALSDGTLTRIDLPEKPVGVSDLLLWTSNGTTVTMLVLNTDYTVDSLNGVVTLTNAVPDGSYVNARGSAYRFFGDDELDIFINTALLQHNHNQTDEFGHPIDITSLPPIEEYPVSLLAVVEALWALATDSSYDISVQTPEGVSIPRGQRMEQIAAMITSRKAQYEELCRALNVGLFRIEMFDLRRQSYATGRLIPIYRPREVEDTRPATRVFPIIGSLGAAPAAVAAITRTDLLSVARQTFTVSFIGLGDLTGKNVYAFVRSYPDTFGYLSKFAVTINDAPSGSVTLTLTPEQTWYLRPSAFWDLGTVDTTTKVQTTLREGEFTTVRQGGVP